MLSSILTKMLAARSVAFTLLAVMTLMIIVILVTSLGARPNTIQLLILVCVGAILSCLSVALIFGNMGCEEEHQPIE
tara:strand:+ start:246 stop:476 length:231 start_codon:yes stop_codon:yes gene_type:complete